MLAVLNMLGYGSRSSLLKTDRMKRSLKSFSLPILKGPALSDVWAPSLREHLENLGRVSCWPQDSHLKKGILPTVRFWEKVPCGKCKPSFILEQMVGMYPLGLGQTPGHHRRVWHYRICFLLGLSENLFLHSLVPPALSFGGARCLFCYGHFCKTRSNVILVKFWKLSCKYLWHI